MTGFMFSLSYHSLSYIMFALPESGGIEEKNLLTEELSKEKQETKNCNPWKLWSQLMIGGR